MVWESQIRTLDPGRQELYTPRLWCVHVCIRPPPPPPPLQKQFWSFQVARVSSGPSEKKFENPYYILLKALVNIVFS